MPIRRGPTPKTGGLLTFIGAQTGTIEELTSGMFGVFGVPYDVSAPDQLGPRLAPKAYRETSTYFQMMTAQDATLIEINSRLPTDTNVVRERVRDLGDLPVSHVDWEILSSTLRDSAKRISSRGAVPIALGRRPLHRLRLGPGLPGSNRREYWLHPTLQPPGPRPPRPRLGRRMARSYGSPPPGLGDRPPEELGMDRRKRLHTARPVADCKQTAGYYDRRRASPTPRHPRCHNRSP